MMVLYASILLPTSYYWPGWCFDPESASRSETRLATDWLSVHTAPRKPTRELVPLHERNNGGSVWVSTRTYYIGSRASP